MTSKVFRPFTLAIIGIFLMSVWGPSVTTALVGEAQAYAAPDRSLKDKSKAKQKKAHKKFHKKPKGGAAHKFEYRNGHKLIIVAPRSRHFKNINVFRPHGHVYWGYGNHHSDGDAWKWLAFTAITLKILDNINEQAQREHEAAQVRATTAPVGERITWTSGAAQGYVVTTREGQSDSGRPCREFQQSVTIDGTTEQAYGTACLQSDGSWEITS